jgi:hypothetical protein
MMGFKALHSAQATIAGIETAHMIRKGQLSEENMPAYEGQAGCTMGMASVFYDVLNHLVALGSVSIENYTCFPAASFGEDSYA